MGYASATLCALCGELGWENKRHAMGELHRVGRRALTALAIRRCDVGLWHLEVPSMWKAGRPAELWLPQPPRRPPHVDAPDRQSYLDEVAVVVLHAIRDQGAGLPMPSLTVICDRYRTSRAWTWRLRRALTELGWLRQAGHVYVTRVPDLPQPSIED